MHHGIDLYNPLEFTEGGVTMVDSKDLKLFYDLYHEVYDDNGDIQLVRRYKCMQLIEAAKKVSPIYGNENNGMTNSANIHALYAELFPNGEMEDDTV